MVAALVPARAVAASLAGDTSTERVGGGVAADGTSAGLPPGWTAARVTDGVYRLATDTGRVEAVDVVRWDAVADVTVTPLDDHRAEIRFSSGSLTVDSGFSFDATVER